MSFISQIKTWLESKGVTVDHEAVLLTAHEYDQFKGMLCHRFGVDPHQVSNVVHHPDMLPVSALEEIQSASGDTSAAEARAAAAAKAAKVAEEAAAAALEAKKKAEDAAELQALEDGEEALKKQAALDEDKAPVKVEEPADEPEESEEESEEA